MTFERLKMLVPEIPDSQAYRIIRSALFFYDAASSEIYTHDVAVACTLERLQDVETTMTDRMQQVEMVLKSVHKQVEGGRSGIVRPAARA